MHRGTAGEVNVSSCPILARVPYPTLPRRLLLTAAAAFLAYQCVGLAAFAKTAVTLPAAAQGIYGLTVGLFVTGVAAFLGFAWPTQRLLPDAYYAIRDPGRLRRAYRGLGVEYFRRFLLATFWRSPAQRAKYFSGTRASLPRLLEMSRKSEFGHLVPGVVCAGAAVVLAVLGGWWAAGALAVGNVIGNG